jgi:hypothetical protein
MINPAIARMLDDTRSQSARRAGLSFSPKRDLANIDEIPLSLKTLAGSGDGAQFEPYSHALAGMRPQSRSARSQGAGACSLDPKVAGVSDYPQQTHEMLFDAHTASRTAAAPRVNSALCVTASLQQNSVHPGVAGRWCAAGANSVALAAVV